MTGAVVEQSADQPQTPREQWTVEILVKEFQKESDRAAVILAASLIDDALTDLLKSFLVPIPTSRDELFDGPTAPISTFSAKIALAFRLGLVSAKFCRDLHIVRDIRNDFAHNIYGCKFDDGSVKSRIDAIKRSAIFSRTRQSIDMVPATPRGDFLYITGGFLWYLNGFKTVITGRAQASETAEMMYVDSKPKGATGA